MATQILFDEELRDKVLSGIKKSASAVKATIGPRGRNVIIRKSYGGSEVSNDGAKIARSINLKCEYEDMGADMVKEVTRQANEIGGDGTTTATTEFLAMCVNGAKNIRNGMNAVGIRNFMQKASEEAVEYLKSVAVELKDEDIERVATISAESEELGKIIAETVKQVGTDGVVDTDTSQTIGVTSEVKQGLEFNSGFVSPYMANTKGHTEADYRDVAVLVTDASISSIPEVVAFGQALKEAGLSQIVLIAENISEDALATFVLTHVRGGVRVLGIKAPGFGENKAEYLKDIAATTGATVLKKEEGFKFENMTVEHLKDCGIADKVLSTKEKTVIIGGRGDNLDEHIKVLKDRIAESDNEFEKDKLKDRVAKLSGGIAVIKVGATSENESAYLKDKIEDAVNATQSAIAEGVVAGGGSALVGASLFLMDSLKKKANPSQEEIVAYNIVSEALKEPLKQIMQNAGREDYAVIASKIADNPRSGYDAKNDTFVEDMLSEGIIDPVRVTRGGVQVSTMAASIFLTTAVGIAEEPEKEMKEEVGY